MARSVLVIAPGHNELDRRVNRSIKVLTSFFDEVKVLYEDRFKSEVVNHENLKYPNLQIEYVNLEGRRMGVFPDFSAFFNGLKGQNEALRCIYIHDSGILGLLIALEAKKLFPDVRLIYDYHDWIPWEIFYQLKKRTSNQVLHRLLFRMVSFFLKSYFRWKLNIDGLVGISDGQLKGFRKYLNSHHEHIPVLAIPNTRVRLKGVHVCDDKEAKLSLVWAGAIMEGRDLSTLLKYLLAVNAEREDQKVELLLIGEVVSESMLHAVASHDFVRHLGPFKGDQDILELLPKEKCVGVFLGWNDLMNTGINGIASPNKIYSYLNVGIPFIASKALTDLSKTIGPGAGVYIDSLDSFKAALSKLDSEYDDFLSRVRQARDRVDWDSNLLEKQTEFISHF